MRAPPFILVLLTSALVATASHAAAYKPPRLSDGHPDLQGDWHNASITTLERPMQYADRKALTADEAAGIEAEFSDFASIGPSGPPEDGGAFNLGQGGDLDAFTTVMRVAGEPRTSLITSTPDGRIPASRPRPPGPAPLSIEDMAANPETMAPVERCVINASANGWAVMLPGEYNNNFRIVQTNTHVSIMIQMANDVRIIRLGARHRTDGVRPWMGDSVARWDGDTLVVETTNFPRAQAFFGAWEQLKVTERFTRVAKDRLLYRFTVEDPTVWDKPWGGEYEFGRPRRAIEEYACHENDHTLQNALEAARYEEGAR